MATEEPKVSMAGRYSIGETAALLGAHRNSIRNWTEAGLMKCSFRKSTNKKFYLGSEILRFWRTMI